MSDTIVSIKNVEKWFDNQHVIKNLSLEIEQGEFLTLLGPSGCGKTTTLRMISGFEHPNSGEIFIEGENVESKAPYQRSVNTVFQHYALFPHMNVEDNIAYGLLAQKVPKEERKKRVAKMLKMVQLEGYEKRKITQMSGGQQQRVAIARALVNEPKVLLLDEPLGALDLQLRKQMQLELKKLQNQLKITFVYVTHDQEEAMTMSDRIAVMNDGILEQIATPRELYERPSTEFVAGFIGESNLLHGTLIEEVGHTFFETSFGRHEVINDRNLPNGVQAAVSVRPENVMLTQDMEQEGFEALITEVIFVGSLVKILACLNNGKEIKITRMASDQIPLKGTKMKAFWDTKKGVLLPLTSGKEK